VTSAVIFVSELDRSVRFYTDVLGCSPQVLQSDAAMLATPSGFQIYLIAKGKLEPHMAQGIGDRHLLWATDSAESLAHLADVLKDRDCYTDSHAAGDVRFVEGHDPDGIRIMVAYPSPAQRPRSVVDARLYR
jgi:catechol 2,3-dioxygenase-like lactoylglutathione lyase family enzyme